MQQTIDKKEIIAKLRAHERELKEAGVLRVRLFESVAVAMPPKSDVDVLAQFNDAEPISLIGLVRIENHLSDFARSQG